MGTDTFRASAEQIADVVADLRAGRVQHAVHDVAGRVVNATALRRVQVGQPVVDATRLYWDLHNRLIAERGQIQLYEEHPSAAPPWDDALICYVNDKGNVIVLQVHAQRREQGKQRWDTPNDIDWGRVKWVLDTMIWFGGRSAGVPVATTGPVHMFQHAVYEDGEPADIHWVQLLAGPQTDLSVWEFPLITLGAALNFLACSNVEIAEPARPRPERRRIARTGVVVQNIVVRPVGKRSRASAGPRAADADDTPLSGVRGHFAHYGEKYGKGLMFGRFEGKFWVPQHARGARTNPDDTGIKDYTLKPAAVKSEATP